MSQPHEDLHGPNLELTRRHESIKAAPELRYKIHGDETALWVPGGSYNVYLLKPVNPDHAQTYCTAVQPKNPLVNIGDYAIIFCFVAVGMFMLCLAASFIYECWRDWRRAA